MHFFETKLYAHINGELFSYLPSLWSALFFIFNHALSKAQ